MKLNFEEPDAKDKAKFNSLLKLINENLMVLSIEYPNIDIPSMWVLLIENNVFTYRISEKCTDPELIDKITAIIGKATLK